jgi:GNAT superfamily N-acetyltransferase
MEPIYRDHIRTALPTDADAISALSEASYLRLLAESYDSGVLRLPLPYMIKVDPKLLASGAYCVAEARPGVLVGFGGWSAARPGSGEIIEAEAHIRRFAVHPEWTRRGLGTSLLTRCIGQARSLGIRKLHCFSTLNAEPFYRPSGFETVGPIDVPMGKTVALPGISMKREIAPGRG